MATFTALRTPFARYWLSGFLADFGVGGGLGVVVDRTGRRRLPCCPSRSTRVAVLAWRHRAWRHRAGRA